MLEKIISGGQTGADQAGLRAAKDCNIPTGGWLPQGCTTLEGPRPDLLETYSMQEHIKPGYAPRTEANVRESDGTVRFAITFKSPGEKCTLKAINWYYKPYLDIKVKKGTITDPPEKLIKWIKEHDIKILNVAGNSEQTSPGIGDIAYNFLVKAFKEK